MTPMRATIAEGVVFRRVGEETVLLDFERGVYFGLNEVGTRVWELVEAGKEEEEIVDTLTGEYEAPRPRIAEDVAALLGELASHGLLIPG
jgi:hypothetical protein